MERPRLIPCPANSEGCKYANTPDGCHLSEHHLYARRTADTSLKRRFGNLATNKVVTCRNIHDTLDTFPVPEYPSVDVMRRAVGRVKKSRGTTTKDFRYGKE